MATDYLELNREVLEELKESNPVKYRSLKLYLECQNVHAETGDWSQAAAHWNAWAENLLAERQELGKSGKWKVKKRLPFGTEGENILTRNWIKFASIDLSNILFIDESEKRDNWRGENNGVDRHRVLLSNMSFADFIFPCDANFWNAKFSGDFSFSYVNIEGDAIFHKAIFCGNAWFPSATFFGRVNFKNAKFKRDANFGDAMICHNSNFSNTTFSGSAWFSKATLSGDARFLEATFSGDAGFMGATFSGDAGFMGATFSGDAGFMGATFSGDAGFMGATFSGDADFSDATFSRFAIFQDATFSSDARFSGATFNDITNFRLAQFEKPVNFSSARFSDLIDFSSIHSKKAFSLHGARFRVAPDFNEAAFHAPPVLDAMHVGEQLTARRGRWPFRFRHVPEPEKNAKRISRNFRTLGKMAHEARDWLNEMEFFAQEIRARRFGEDFPLGEYRVLRGLGWWLARKCRLRFLGPLVLKLRRKAKSSPWRGPNMGRFWFGLIYEKASNFGRSFARPLALWAVTTALFAVLYAALASEWGVWNGWDALYLSVRHGLVVGGLVRTGHMQQVIEAMFGEMGSGLALLMMFQTLVSAYFLFLFFLAVRNHFRIR